MNDSPNHSFSSDREDSMVRCSNQDCPLGSWFHNECVGINPDDVPGPDEDWWCSTECRETQSSVLCRCKMVKDEEMFPCSSPNCNQGMKFHLSCVHLSEAPGMAVTMWTLCVNTEHFPFKLVGQ